MDLVVVASIFVTYFTAVTFVAVFRFATHIAAVAFHEGASLGVCLRCIHTLSFQTPTRTALVRVKH